MPVLEPSGAIGADNGDITDLPEAVDLALLEVEVVVVDAAVEDAGVLDGVVAVVDVAAVEDAGLLLVAARCFRPLFVVLGRAP